MQATAQKLAVMGRALRNRIRCSRPGLAWHVLMGRPLMYRMPTIVVADIIVLTGRERVVGCRFDVSAIRAGKAAVQTGTTLAEPA